MSIQTLQDKGSSYKITAPTDGAVYRLQGGDCVLEGMGDEFTIGYSASSLNVTFATGSEACICGNFFLVTATETLALTANATNYVCARIDRTGANGATGSFVAITQAEIQTGNINASSSAKRDLLLYIVTTNATGVTSVTDRRVIRGEGSTISGLSLWSGTQAQYDALTPDANTLYFILEA